MEVRRYQSGSEFFAAAGPMLLAREVEHSLLLGFAQADREFRDPELALAAFSGGRPVAALIQTSINESIVGPGMALAMRALGRSLAEAGTRSRGVVGPREEADAAAGAFASRAGVSTRVERRLLLHRLEGPPRATPDGERLRPAEPDDEPLLLEWAAGFEEETRTPPHGRSGVQRIRQGIESGRLFVLVAGGRPVAAASWGRPTGHTRTINCVYTPPDERGRGRGRVVTALLAEHLLEKGTRDVLIFTDADDPTPNRVYARVGFRVVAEFQHREFLWPRG